MLNALAKIGAFLIVLSFPVGTQAKDDGRWTNNPLHGWFDKLASGKGLCCSFADGVKLEDPEWDRNGSFENGGSGYRVKLNGVWLEVPENALVNEKNRAEVAYVWPYQDASGATQIRCFIPGVEASNGLRHRS